jgi:hypothetical protein
MADKSWTGRSGRHTADADWMCPTLTSEFSIGNRFGTTECFLKRAQPPTCRRHDAFAANEDFFYVHRRKISEALAPPKPKELERA